MDVPLFPTPPAFGGAADVADAATSPVISDIYDDASSDVVTHVAQREPGRNREYQRERHAAAVTAAIHSKVRGARLLRGKRYRLGGASKNIVHPRGPITSGARRRHVTEFRLRMTERQRNDKVEEEEAQKNVDGDDDEKEDDDDDDDDDDVVACADSFGAPVPRTNAGRTVAIIFAAIGIPAHFLLIMNLGILLAVRLQKYAIGRTMNDKDTHRDSTTEVCHSSTPPVPKWVKVVPFVCIGGYYILGVLCFGIARSRPLAASVLFPLDFTAAGGLSTTRGYVRVLYAIYLEGAVVIAAVAVAVLRVSATQSLTNIGLKYGLLTEA